MFFFDILLDYEYDARTVDRKCQKERKKKRRVKDIIFRAEKFKMIVENRLNNMIVW
jgi:hypothetical protein